MLESLWHSIRFEASPFARCLVADELSTRKAEMVVKAEDDRKMLLKPGAEPDIPSLDQRLQSWGEYFMQPITTKPQITS